MSSSSLSDPYHPIATASLNTPVFDVVHMFSERSISAVPIIDEDGIVVNMYETVDVIVCHISCKFRGSLNVRFPCTPRRWCAWERISLSVLLFTKH